VNPGDLVLKYGELGEENQRLISKFLEHLAAEGICKRRQEKYFYQLKKIAKWLKEETGKNLKDATKEDLIKIAAKINNGKFKEWTKHDYLIALRKFYSWLDGVEEGYSERVKWIKAKRVSQRKLPDELLTKEEVERMAQFARNPRDKAMVLALFEGAFRASELLNIKVKDVVNDQYGMKVKVKGKGGHERIVRLIAAQPAINLWLQQHPKRSDPDFRESYLFCGLWSKKRGEKMNYAHLRKIIKELAEKAGIKKRIHLHLFRHSRLSDLATKLTESQLSEYAGWVQGSKMASVYVHLSQKNIDRAILKIYGKIKEDEEKERFQPIRCPRCKQEVSPGFEFCPHCGLSLDEKSLIEFDRQKEICAIAGMILKKAKGEQWLKNLLKEALRELLFEGVAPNR